MGNTALMVSPISMPGFPSIRSRIRAGDDGQSAPLLLVVNPSVPVQSVQELIAYAKAIPGKLNYGSGGVGSTPYLSTELFKSMTGIDVVHVPYKGGAPALADLVAGQLTFMIENVPGTLPLVKSGKLRALAITSRIARRSCPTCRRWPRRRGGLRDDGMERHLRRQGHAAAIVARLGAELAKVLSLPDVKEQMATLGAEPGGDTPQAFGAFVAAEIRALGQDHQGKRHPPRVEPGAERIHRTQVNACRRSSSYGAGSV